MLTLDTLRQGTSLHWTANDDGTMSYAAIVEPTVCIGSGRMIPAAFTKGLDGAVKIAKEDSARLAFATTYGELIDGLLEIHAYAENGELGSIRNEVNDLLDLFGEEEMLCWSE